MDQIKLNEFIQRYVAMWHEVDPARRRRTIADVFAKDAEDYTTKSVFRGLQEIYDRVTRAHEEWVVRKAFTFKPDGNAHEHHGVIKFSWKMVPKQGGSVASRGVDIFFIRQDGLVRALYQFSE